MATEGKLKTEKAPGGLVEDISLWEKIAYGSGDFASNLVLTFASSFMTYFYTDSVGISIGTVGTIMLISRIFDGISDVLMGILVDKTHSRLGKARPWLLWLAVPIGIATVLLVTVPNVGMTGKIIYAFVTYNLVTTIFYTGINLPYGTLNSLMTRDQYQRSVINIFRMVLAALGNVFVTGITLPLVNRIGGTQGSWITVACLYGSLAAMFFLTCFRFTKERVSAGNTEAASKIPLKDSFRAMSKNNYWLIICLAGTVVSIASAFLTVNSIYFAKYILGNEELSGILTILTFAPAGVSLVASTPLIKRFGKRNVAMAGAIIAILGQCILFFNPTNMTVIIVSGMIRGFGLGPPAGTVFAMVADTIEYGEWKTGLRVQGLLYSSTSFGGKIGTGLGNAITGYLLKIAGYDGTLEQQTESALRMIKTLYVYPPAIFGFFILICLVFYKLDKIYPQVIADLQEREERSAGQESLSE